MTTLLEAIEAAPEQPGAVPLADSWLLGFDTETTGARPGRDAIVSASLVLRNPQRGHRGDVTEEWLINPHRPMDPRATRVNGFTDDYLVSHGGEPTVAVEQVARAIAGAQARGIPLLAYNAPFDVGMMEGDLRRWKLASLRERIDGRALVVDPLVLDRAVSHRHGRRTLSDTTEYYGVEPEGDFHAAASDAVAAVDLVAPMTSLHPQLQHLTLDALMDWQRRAHREWLESFNAWLQARGRRPAHDGWFD